MCVIRQFGKNIRGNISIIFALLMVPAILGSGVAIDYSMAAADKTALQNLADSAALAAAKAANDYIAANGSSSVAISAAQAAGAAVANEFTSNGAQSLHLVGAPQSSVNTTINGSNTSTTVNITAQYPTFFASILGMTTIAIQVTASASQAYVMPQYANFYIAIDNSQSMGIAATSSGMSALSNQTGGCAFGCHVTTTRGQASYEDVAEQNNITLRIDLARTAIASFIGSLTGASSNAYNISVYGINKTLTQLIPQTTNISTALSAIGTNYLNSDVDLASVALNPDGTGNRGDAQTAFDVALPLLNGDLPSSDGTGSSSSSPKNYVFIITDGVADEMIGGMRTYGVLNPTLCSSLKQKATVVVLYADYYPVTGDPGFEANVEPLLSPNNEVSASLKSCATTGFYYDLADYSDLNTAMSAMFKASTSTAVLRLTN